MDTEEYAVTVKSGTDWGKIRKSSGGWKFPKKTTNGVNDETRGGWKIYGD